MDKEIEQRLRGLDDTVNELVKKNKQKELQKEIELRLAKLNERDPNFYSTQEPPVKLLSIKKHRTAVEETDELLKKFIDEVQIDEKRIESSMMIDEELEKRLKQLEQEQAAIINNNRNNNNNKNPMLKKFRQTGNLIHQLMISRNLDIREPNIIVDDDNEYNDDDDDIELNDDVIDSWCITCNEDGVLRCIDCDMDIYCLDCFKELHRDRDMRKHRTQPYEKSS